MVEESLCLSIHRINVAVVKQYVIEIVKYVIVVSRKPLCSLIIFDKNAQAFHAIGNNLFSFDPIEHGPVRFEQDKHSLEELTRVSISSAGHQHLCSRMVDRHQARHDSRKTFK